MTDRILVVDDSTTIQKVIRIAFSRYNVSIATATSFVEALSEANLRTPDIILADATLAGAKVPDDFVRLRTEARGAPVILLVGSYENVNEEAFRAQGFKWIVKKPFESSDIVRIVTQVLGHALPLEDEEEAEAEALPRPKTRATDAVIPTSPSDTHFVPPPPADSEEGEGDESWGESFKASARQLTPDEVKTVPPAPPRTGQPITFDEDEDGPPEDIFSGSSPLSPETDATRRGKRAFDQDAASDWDDDTDENSGAAEPVFNPPPPPDVTDYTSYHPALDDEDDEVEDVEAADEEEAQAPTASDERFRLPREQERKGPAEPAGKHAAGSQPMGGTSRRIPGYEQPKPAKVKGILEPLIRDELALLVKKAVEDYCQRHFAQIAREVITAEIRRLAEEKARHLVDS